MSNLIEKTHFLVTIDLEDHRKYKIFETQRYEKNAEKILQWLEEKK